MKSITRDKILESNQKVHSLLVKSGDYQQSPHFKEENQAKVRSILQKLAGSLHSTTRMVDFGCGTGFIINLSKDLFDEVHGVDITPEMMALIDTSSNNIILTESTAEQTPYPSEHFEFATAYSFMDHLEDLENFLVEVYRVLQKGGVFYSDLNPNREFIQAMSQLEANEEATSPLMRRELKAALHNGEHYAQEYGIDPETLECAEPIKTVEKGFLAKDITRVAKKVGFSDCRIELDWYVDQGTIIHQHSNQAAEEIDSYLRSILPMSAHLFKYIRIVLTK
ncbi:hypothetical protein OAG1_16220 [Agarivorans sp. OAG1]|uniref:class I SAM-dependent methyltransferase n=1 Tax=Agarivorans sp. OAG1 TaxID=3082387 RepID=UPI002B309E5A|nr:hypothetical protein OAG1_16220 [Agarivorans sp. OAG1]